ncbi:Rps23 Pro-64 3,4-dihydroxylase Tpa1-like proline 4-hydroxylase [Lachnospiraceae bacterium PF1-22]
MCNELYIACEFNKNDARKIGLVDGDVSLFKQRLIEYKNTLSEAGIVISTFGIFIHIFDNIRIQYQTVDAYSNGNIIYIKDKEEFFESFRSRNQNIYEAWIGILNEISADIDELENRYSEYKIGSFLRSLLVYFTAFRVVERVEEINNDN